MLTLWLASVIPLSVVAQEPASTANDGGRNRIIFKLPRARSSASGELIVEPDVQIESGRVRVPARTQQTRLPEGDRVNHRVLPQNPLQAAVKYFRADGASAPKGAVGAQVDETGVGAVQAAGNSSPLAMPVPEFVAPEMTPDEPSLTPQRPFSTVSEGGATEPIFAEVYDETLIETGEGEWVAEGEWIVEPESVFESSDRSWIHYPQEPFLRLWGWMETWFPIKETCHHCSGCDDECRYCKPFRHLPSYHQPSIDEGIGHERLPFALVATEPSQPSNNFRVRFDSAIGLESPARGEYFWAMPGDGPAFETSVDYQELHGILEMGGSRFSTVFDIPLRILNPVINDNTAGLSNISIMTKTVMVDGNTWQLTQTFATLFNSGSQRKGLGPGHTSLEPGMLARYVFSDQLIGHGQLAVRFPISGQSDFAGQLLRYGGGASFIMYETDTFAILPTAEVVGWTIFDGRRTTGPPAMMGADPPSEDISGQNLISMHVGSRLVLGPRGDLGLFELGFSHAWDVTRNGWYDSRWRVEMRWSW